MAQIGFWLKIHGNGRKGEGCKGSKKSSWEMSAKESLTMAKLIYAAITSLDGYIADKDDKFDWAMPDKEVHAAVNDIERPIGTYLYGRRMYEVMVFWETAQTVPGQPPFVPGLELPERDFAKMWRAADKIVYSKSIEAVSSSRTRIERTFDPAVVRQMKSRAGRDITVGGPNLAAQMIKARLVDEYHLFVNPIVVGGGKKWLPDDVLLKLELIAERRFGNGVVHVHYRAST